MARLVTLEHTDAAADDTLRHQTRGADGGIRYDRDVLADVDDCGLVIQGHDLRTRQEIDASLGL